MENDDFSPPRFLNELTNISEVEISDHIIAAYGRDVWEELMEIAQCGYIFTSNRDILDGLKAVLDRTLTDYTVEDRRVKSFRYYVKLKFKDHPIVYLVGNSADNPD